jgi:topoisomerase-4 subunit B
MDLMRAKLRTSRSIRSSTSSARTWRSPSHTAPATARNTTASSTASTPPRAAPTSPPSARPSCRSCREFFKKQFDPADVRGSLIAAVSVKVQEPVFESQTKTKLGSTHMEPNGRNLRGHHHHRHHPQLDNFLHKHTDIAKSLQEKINANEKERKEISGIQKAARENARKAKVHNKKLRDCRIHFDTKDKRRDDSTLFITEGDSASGSITKSRDVETQAVFSLRGKPLNCFGLTRKIVYENEEFYLLANALQIEDGPRSPALQARRARHRCRCGRHAHPPAHDHLLPPVLPRTRPQRPPLHPANAALPRAQQKGDHLLLQRLRAPARHPKLGKTPRSPASKASAKSARMSSSTSSDPNMRLEPVTIRDHALDADGNPIPSEHKSVKEMLTFYMGKNTPERQTYIVENLRIEEELEFNDREYGAAYSPIFPAAHALPRKWRVVFDTLALPHLRLRRRALTKKCGIGLLTNSQIC